jgi:hypothetical protein
MNSLRYATGEEVKRGDRVLYRGLEGIVEFVVVENTGDPALDWYLTQFAGGGIMIRTPELGPTFLSAQDVDGDILFIARAETSPPAG